MPFNRFPANSAVSGCYQSTAIESLILAYQASHMHQRLSAALLTMGPMVFAKLYLGDALEVMKTFKSDSVDMCMTSPPYWGLRDYGVKGQLGLEESPNEYIQKIVNYFHELKRILKPTGSFYLNLGSTYTSNPIFIIKREWYGKSSDI